MRPLSRDQLGFGVYRRRATVEFGLVEILLYEVLCRTTCGGMVVAQVLSCVV